MRDLTLAEQHIYWGLDELSVPLSNIKWSYSEVADGDSTFNLMEVKRMTEDLTNVVAIYTKPVGFSVAFGYKIIPVNIWLGDIVEEEEQAAEGYRKVAEDYAVGDRVLVKMKYHIFDRVGIDEDTLDDICGTYQNIVDVREGMAVQLMGDSKRYWWPLSMVTPATHSVKPNKSATKASGDTDYINQGPSPYKLYNGPRIGEIRKEFKRK